MRRNEIGIAMIVASVLAGCSLVKPGSALAPKVDLRAGTWVAEDIDGLGVIGEAQSTLVFGNDGRVSGRGGCNQYSGTVELEGASIIISHLISTKMACAPAQMDQETRFMSALQAARTYKMTEDNRLVFSDATGKPRLWFSR